MRMGGAIAVVAVSGALTAASLAGGESGTDCASASAVATLFSWSRFRSARSSLSSVLLI